MMTLPQLRKLAKVDMNGNFERLKARLVARGNEMDETLYKDTSSPTISTVHVMAIMAIAAKVKRKLHILDVGNAVLEADMKSGEDIFVELDYMSTRILGMIDHTGKKSSEFEEVVAVMLLQFLAGGIPMSTVFNMLHATSSR